MQHCADATIQLLELKLILLHGDVVFQFINSKISCFPSMVLHSLV